MSELPPPPDAICRSCGIRAPAGGYCPDCGSRVDIRPDGTTTVEVSGRDPQDVLLVARQLTADLIAGYGAPAPANLSLEPAEATHDDIAETTGKSTRMRRWSRRGLRRITGLAGRADGATANQTGDVQGAAVQARDIHGDVIVQLPAHAAAADRDIARDIRREERREASLFAWNATVVDVIDGIDRAYRCAERDPAACPAAWADMYRHIERLRTTWEGSVSGQIPDQTVVAKYLDVRGQAHDCASRFGRPTDPPIITGTPQDFVREAGRLLMLLGELGTEVARTIDGLREA